MSATFMGERRAGQQRDLVAVKVLKQRVKGDVERLLRLRDSGREVALLRHPNLASVEDVARVGELLALISPYVDGIDLLDWVEVLKEEGVSMPARARCEIVLGIAVALDAALHDVLPGSKAPANKVHRDIRPANVMITRNGQVRLLDTGTGFTSLVGREARAGALKKGLIKYMSPRRREGKRGGPPEDIYALGIVALELFRGRWLRRLRSHNPAHDRYLAEVVARLTDLGMRNEQDELVLRNLLLRMIAYDPEARPDAAEVAQTFAGLAERARGLDLATFAQSWAQPFLDDPASADPELAEVAVQLIDWDDQGSDLVLESLPPRLQVPSDRSGGALWEETEEGWRMAGWEQPDEVEFLDEDDDDAPLPGAPPLDRVRARTAAEPDDVSTDPIDYVTTEQALRVVPIDDDQPTTWEPSLDLGGPKPAPAPQGKTAPARRVWLFVAVAGVLGLLLIGAGVALGAWWALS